MEVAMFVLLPAFQKHASAGAVIGRLVAGYGELEFDLCRCLAAVWNDEVAAVQEVFRLRGERKRMETIDKRARTAYAAAGLGQEYEQAFSAMDWCRETRNQYAHCSWASYDKKGLAFVNLGEGAKLSGKSVPLTFYPIDFDLLRRQELYFMHARACMDYLKHAYDALHGRGANPFERIPQQDPPPRHNEPTWTDSLGSPALVPQD
jgi:hypothetical protein